ncbi:MAG: hypothetical protein EOP83_10260 [Verrucomicrobiaceae bacterium]|nr:MAG: hypothetical protein EOP83_10260 [Verrucomicrobiaceae bacterium]
MSAVKARSLARRLELLDKAINRGPIEVNCQGGIASTNRDLKRLVHDGHLKQTRIVYTNKTRTAFEVTTEGRGFYKANEYVAQAKEQIIKVANAQLLRIPPSMSSLFSGRSSGRSKEDRLSLARRSADTARLLSAALLETEEKPFVVDTGWIDSEVIQSNPLFKVMERAQNPGDGFTLFDRLYHARTPHLRRFLKDSRAMPTFEMLVVRTLGGGAVVCRLITDQERETYELRRPIQEAWLAECKRDPELIRTSPTYPVAPLMCRMLLLASHETMATYIQLGLR